MTDLEIITADRNPDLFDDAQVLVDESFAEFMDHSEVVCRLWKELYTLFPEYQYLMREPGSDTVAVLGNCFPLAWRRDMSDLPGGGVEWGLETAVEQAQAGEKPTVLCAFQIITNPRLRGRGLSYRAVETMIDIARRHGLSDLIAPVRPNRKENHPDMPMDHFVRWKRDDGLPVDDWLRVHVRLGGRILHICEESFVVSGSISEWERWTGQVFASSGAYPVEGGLVPVEIDREKDHGVYTEPNVWVWHHVAPL